KDQRVLPVIGGRLRGDPPMQEVETQGAAAEEVVPDLGRQGRCGYGAASQVDGDHSVRVPVRELRWCVCHVAYPSGRHVTGCRR
ncbi:MAG: hypothetical protein LUP91_17210, partial [Methylococcaceae bacterium]|nr:hypothetical protein [Methylococcaceae bacterium]